MSTPLLPDALRKAAASLGFRLDVNYRTATVNRGVVEGVSHQVLSRFPALCQWLPCTTDFIFTKA